jgi:formiminotetrahydrofolate cyclodeaminase
MLTHKTVTDLLDAFSSPDPTPGGGSAAALAGALGVSLFAMVAGLPKTRTGSAEERAALDDARARLLALRATFVDLVDRDAAAYDLVVAAYKHPKTTDAEKAARKAAVQDAMRIATEVPIETLQAAADGLNVGVIVAAQGNPSARSDVAVGLQLLMTAVQGAFLNASVNLGSLTDPALVQTLTAGIKARLDATGESVRAIYQSGPLVELMKEASARVGLQHGRPPGAAT